MRRLLLGIVPSLPSAIYRPPQTTEEREEAQSIAPFGVQEGWRWEDADERLKRAYEEGGISLYMKFTLTWKTCCYSQLFIIFLVEKVNFLLGLEKELRCKFTRSYDLKRFGKDHNIRTLYTI